MKEALEKGFERRALVEGEIYRREGVPVAPVKTIDAATRKRLISEKQHEEEIKMMGVTEKVLNDGRDEELLHQREWAEAKKALRRGKFVFDEIEEEIKDKYKGFDFKKKFKHRDPNAPGYRKELEPIIQKKLERGHRGHYVARKALVDEQLAVNNKADFSYAVKRYKWAGEQGDFNSVDLAAWYRVYHQTNIQNVSHLKDLVAAEAKKAGQ